MHQRNLHSERYDFRALIKSSPELAVAVRDNMHGDLSIDFAKPESVKLLNRALLKHYYQVAFWDIPAGYLCPPIPSRADYIHYMADLLAASNAAELPKGRKVCVLDIGMGANCVYPIVGTRLYGWTCVGADIDPVAVKTANMLADINPLLKGRIRCRLQKTPGDIFKDVFHEDELFDLTMCNPPFHGSLAQATAGTERKVNNLAVNTAKKGKRAGFNIKSDSLRKKSPLNFGGQGAELWCPGGEAAFIKRMIMESVEYGAQCLWFSSLVSKKENLSAIYKALKTVGAAEFKTFEMQHGQKNTRVVAWTFQTVGEQAQWCRARW